MYAVKQVVILWLYIKCLYIAVDSYNCFVTVAVTTSPAEVSLKKHLMIIDKRTTFYILILYVAIIKISIQNIYNYKFKTNLPLSICSLVNLYVNKRVQLLFMKPIIQ